MKYNFTLKRRIAFYWTYCVAKSILLWFEVKEPKCIMFVYEMIYSLRKFISRDTMLPSPFATDHVETTFGKFVIRPHTPDMVTVSPAYERTDLLHLLDLLKELTDNGGKILFLDIGAYIGTYSVTVGNRFREYDDLHIVAFEPALPNYKILEKNVAMNDLRDKIDLCNVALFDNDMEDLGFSFSPGVAISSKLVPLTPGRNICAVSTKALDSIIGDNVKEYDAVVMKIDVEGAEREVLKGAKRIIDSGVDVHLMVEDFTDAKILSYLEENGAEFVVKLSPYNSWWKWKR